MVHPKGVWMEYINYFKRKLKTQQQIGLWVGLADAYGTEIAANAGYDWLLIDGEHAPSDLRTTLSQLQSIAAYGFSAITTFIFCYFGDLHFFAFGFSGSFWLFLLLLLRLTVRVFLPCL